MNRKLITHVIIITTIVLAVFIAAALTPAGSYTKASDKTAAVNIEKVDFEARSISEGKSVIADSQIPLAASPVTAYPGSAWIIIAAVSVVLMGAAVYEGCKNFR